MNRREPAVAGALAQARAAPAHPPAAPGARGQWREPPMAPFTRSQREHTTILLGGLTKAHDQLAAAALRGLGYRAEALPTPDNEALELGKVYCNRSMCNPAYYTVGNLLRHLEALRETHGLTRREIVERYLLATVNGCGPCRFALYIGEYRKALRESGLEGFRVLLLNQGPETNGGQEQGLEVNAGLLFAVGRAMVLGDVLNALTYRVRPYELRAGATERAIQRALERLAAALERGSGPRAALRLLRGELAAIPVDRTRIKPKVSIIGEIWAQTTEGEGSYRLPAFLEQEGAEVEVQSIAAWILLIMWEKRYDAGRRAGLDPGGAAQGERRPGAWKTWLAARCVEWLLRLHFRAYARAAGLYGYELPDCDALAASTHALYDVNQRGGEMFMEVAKALHAFRHRKAHLVVSVKPFGCMPSSGVSDGIHALVAERFPHALILPVETTGDGKINVYSRLQMQLYKARGAAAADVRDALQPWGLTLEQARALLAQAPLLGGALGRLPRRFACTAANLVFLLGQRRRGFPWRWMRPPWRRAR